MNPYRCCGVRRLRPRTQCADHSVHGRPLARPNKVMHLVPSAQVIGALARLGRDVTVD